jgi:endoglucanase
VKGCAVALRALALAGWLLLAATAPRAQTEPVAAGLPLGDGPGASRKAWAAAAALSRGINLAVYAAPREGDWGLRMDDRWVDTLAKAGFRSVRLSVRWSNHAAASADATLDEAFARRIDRLVDALLARGLRVVVNMGFYSQLDGRPLEEGEMPVAQTAVRPRFVNLWRQLAKRYAGRSDRLLFELYNAPRGDAQAWNDLAASALAAIRKSSPERLVVVGPLFNEAAQLARLSLPRDGHLIVTIHNREPRQFTGQGSPWYPGSEKWLGTPCCDAQQRQALALNLDIAKAWSAEHRYPVWLGSFGAASTAPMPQRAHYLRAMRDAAQARGMSWAHADFAANFNVRDPPLDSGIYDVVRRRWHPSLLEALLGP